MGRDRWIDARVMTLGVNWRFRHTGSRHCKPRWCGSCRSFARTGMSVDFPDRVFFSLVIVAIGGVRIVATTGPFAVGGEILPSTKQRGGR